MQTDTCLSANKSEFKKQSHLVFVRPYILLLSVNLVCAWHSWFFKLFITLILIPFKNKMQISFISKRHSLKSTLEEQPIDNNLSVLQSHHQLIGLFFSFFCANRVIILIIIIIVI